MGDADSSSKLKPTFRSNVLMNANVFSNYDEYVFGTLSLSAEQVARFLRIRVLEETPDVWNIFNQWGRDDQSALSRPVGPAEFKTWLQRLYLQTVLPPHRDCRSSQREARPNTVDLFIRTCTFCIEVLGYPVH